MASHRNTIFGTQISSGAGAGAGHGGGSHGGGRQSMAPGASTSGQSGAAVKARQIVCFIFLSSFFHLPHFFLSCARV